MPLTATPQPANVPPRVLLTASGLTGTTQTIVRNDPDGRTRAVRTAEPATLSSGGWTGFDYEAPFGAPVTYTVSGTTTVSSAITLDVDTPWLLHPGVPALSQPFAVFNVAALDVRTRAARAGVHQPLGRSTPIVVSETLSSVRSAITVLTETLVARDAMWALLQGGDALLLNIPPALGWGVTWEYISVGDVSETYLTQGSAPERLWPLQYSVVDRPAGSLVAQWSYAGVLGAANMPTYADVLTNYRTYSDLVANTQG